MHAVILAAGYATRMFPLTENCPKALLPVGGVQIIDCLLSKLLDLDDLNHIFLVTNHKFYPQFNNWLNWRKHPSKIALIDDGTVSNESRLGAIGDLGLTIDRMHIDDDLLVLGSDNIFKFALAELVRFANLKQADCVVARQVSDMAARQRMGIAVIESDGRIIDFEEKPKEPKSEWAIPPIYYFQRDTLTLIPRYLHARHNPDAPGNFIAWLHKQKPVYALKMNSQVLAISTLDSFVRANQWLNHTTLKEFGFRAW
jgi:glucose-1-phosphate thymidylyltransferase